MNPVTPRIYPWVSPKAPFRVFQNTVHPRFGTTQPAEQSEQHPLFRELMEQPTVLRKLLQADPEMFAPIRRPATKKPTHWFLIGEGSSGNALKLAASWLRLATRQPVSVLSPEDVLTQQKIGADHGFNYKRPWENGFFLTASQSGTTASLLRALSVLERALNKADAKLPVLSFSNNPQGTLATRYRNNIPLVAGPETAIAATKSMTASIFAVMQFAINEGLRQGKLTSAQANAFSHELKQVPTTLEKLLNTPSTHQQLKNLAAKLAGNDQFVLLSTGAYADALAEAGLKLTETSSNMVFTQNTESFKHGPKVILKGVRNRPPHTLYVIPPNLSPQESERFFGDMRAHFLSNGKPAFSTRALRVIRFENSPTLPDTLKKDLKISTDSVVTLPAASETAGLFSTIVAFQLLSYFLAEAKGENPNHATLSKSVTA